MRPNHSNNQYVPNSHIQHVTRRLRLRPDSSGYVSDFVTSAWLNIPTLFCGSVLGVITTSIGSWRGEKSRWLEIAFWINSFLFIASIGLIIVLGNFTRFT